MSRTYYDEILRPVLEFSNIHHEMFVTDSPVYIENFIKKLDLESAQYTDFVVIGGDGMFSQLINSITKHPDRENLLKLPIGIIPGGSSNALACDLSCKDPCQAVINIVKGTIVKCDMFELHTNDTGLRLYSSALTYGFPVDLSIESENMRNTFGRYRYVACGIKRLLSTRPILYDAEIFYKTEEDDLIESVHSKPKFQKLGSKDDTKISRKTSRNLEIKTKKSKEGKWNKLTFDNKFLFAAVVTHEIRSSINNEVFAPYAKLGEGNMYLAGVKRLNRLDALTYVQRASKNTQVTYEKYFYKKVTELRFKCPEGSNFCVDGEAYKSNDFSIKLLPHFVTLFGKKDHIKF